MNAPLLVCRTQDPKILAAYAAHGARRRAWHRRLTQWAGENQVPAQLVLDRGDGHVLGLAYPQGRTPPLGWHRWGDPATSEVIVPASQSPHGRQLARDLLALRPPPELPLRLPELPGGTWRLELREDGTALYARWEGILGEQSGPWRHVDPADYQRLAAAEDGDDSEAGP